jgi:hypothetical protein
MYFKQPSLFIEQHDPTICFLRQEKLRHGGFNQQIRLLQTPLTWLLKWETSDKQKDNLSSYLPRSH